MSMKMKLKEKSIIGCLAINLEVIMKLQIDFVSPDFFAEIEVNTMLMVSEDCEPAESIIIYDGQNKWQFFGGNETHKIYEEMKAAMYNGAKVYNYDGKFGVCILTESTGAQMRFEDFSH